MPCKAGLIGGMVAIGSLMSSRLPYQCSLLHFHPKGRSAMKSVLFREILFQNFISAAEAKHKINIWGLNWETPRSLARRSGCICLLLKDSCAISFEVRDDCGREKKRNLEGREMGFIRWKPEACEWA